MRRGPEGRRTIFYLRTFMRSHEDDRVRVTRVRIECKGGLQEISECWIAVNPDRKEVGIWLAPDDSQPVATASLDQTIIDWPEFTIPDSP